MTTTGNNKEITLRNGTKVTVIMNPGKNTDDMRILETEDEKNNRPFMVGGADIKTLQWGDFFDNKLINYLFRDYREPDGSLSFVLSDPEDLEKSRIGFRLGLENDVTGEITSQMVYRDSIGTLMVTAFILIECVDLEDKRGRSYSVWLPKNVNKVYEHFFGRIETEATEKMKSYFAFTGGLLEATIKSRATSPEKIFAYLRRIVK